MTEENRTDVDQTAVDRTHEEPPDGALGLADFLSDLRAELSEADRRAEGEALQLEVGEVTVTLDVGVTVATTGEVSTKASAKFWVFASAEGSARGQRSSERMTTQRLTLTLTPWIKEVKDVPTAADLSRRVQATLLAEQRRKPRVDRPRGLEGRSEL